MYTHKAPPAYRFVGEGAGSHAKVITTTRSFKVSYDIVLCVYTCI